MYPQHNTQRDFTHTHSATQRHTEEKGEREREEVRRGALRGRALRDTPRHQRFATHDLSRPLLGAAGGGVYVGDAAAGARLLPVGAGADGPLQHPLLPRRPSPLMLCDAVAAWGVAGRAAVRAVHVYGSVLYERLIMSRID